MGNPRISHLGPMWESPLRAHDGQPTSNPHGFYVGCPPLAHIWVTHVYPTWDPCGKAHSGPTMGYPHATHVQPTWVLCGLPTFSPYMGNPRPTHMGPMWDIHGLPIYGLKVGSPHGTHVGWTWVAHAHHVLPSTSSYLFIISPNTKCSKQLLQKIYVPVFVQILVS